MHPCTEETESVESMTKHLSLIITMKEEVWRIAKCENTIGEVSQPQYTEEALHIKDTSSKNQPHSAKKLLSIKTNSHEDIGPRKSKKINRRIKESLNPMETKNLIQQKEKSGHVSSVVVIILMQIVLKLKV